MNVCYWLHVWEDLVVKVNFVSNNVDLIETIDFTAILEFCKHLTFSVTHISSKVYACSITKQYGIVFIADVATIFSLYAV